MKPRKFKTVDVRDIIATGGEPFPAIRSAVDVLAKGEGLSVIAPFLPSPLIERLGSEGFRSDIARQADGTWITYFWRDND